MSDLSTQNSVTQVISLQTQMGQIEEVDPEAFPQLEDLDRKSTGSIKTLDCALSTPQEQVSSQVDLDQNSSDKIHKGMYNFAFEGEIDEKNNNLNKALNFPEVSLNPSKKDAANENVKEEKAYKGMKRYLGMMLTLFASLCFSLTVLFVKMLSTDYGFNGFGSSFWRYAGTTIPTIPLLMLAECQLRRRKEFDPEKWGDGKKASKKSVFDSVWPFFKNENWKQWIGLLSRGLIGSTSVILRYYALEYLSIGDTSVITYSTPVLVTVMAHLFLGERCGYVQIIIAFTTLIGVVIVTRPPLLTGGDAYDTDTLIGTGLAVGSLFCASLIVIITRKIREVHYALMTLIFGIIGVAQAYLSSYFSGGDLNIPVGMSDGLLTLGVAGLSFLGQMSIVLALKFENAGPVALIRSCDVIFGFLLQFIVLGISPDVWSSVGGTIVLAGVIITGVRKWLTTLPETNPTRQRFAFLMR